MLVNKKMRVYLDRSLQVDLIEPEGLNFTNMARGYFFERVINPSLKVVVDTYAPDRDFDWPGFEYSANKIHLEDDFNAAIPVVANFGIGLVQRLANRFKIQFPSKNAVFCIGCDEFGEFPSVTLSFYVKRDGSLPLLPEDEASLEKFDNAILILS